MWIKYLPISKITKTANINYTTISLSFATMASKNKANKTYYQILQVPATATMANIRQNYLKLAKIYHPDVYKGKDKQRFPKIQQAYKILSDKIKRVKYDQQIGVIRPKKDNASQQQFAQKTGAQPNPQKPKNPMSYQQQMMKAQKQQQVDLQQQFNKFFKKKPKTKFQQIRLHQQVQIRSMSQKQRIRRHFTNTYQNPDALGKAQYQKQFDQILDDQIQQKNRHFEDNKKKQKKIEQTHSDKGVKKLKKRAYLIFLAAIIITIPILSSFVTKYRLQKQEQQKAKKFLGQLERLVEQRQIRSRLSYN